MSDKFTNYARNRAAIATFFFGVIALASLNSIDNWQKSWPLVVFYAVLILNTYFSVRTFASITPKENLGQHLIDLILAACLVLIALNFNSILNFIILTMLLFIVATLKYIYLTQLVGYSKLLYMKIRIDTLGILFCFLAVIGTMWGYGRQVSIIWLITFVLANVYVLWGNPHYHPEMHYEK